MAYISFKETQHFRQIWVWALLLCISGLTLWGVIQQLFLDKPFGTNPAPDIVLLLSSIIPVILVVLLLTARLETEIDETGIYYRFFPFHFKQHKIEWSSLDSAIVRKYKPILEYGGWGIRGLLRTNRAYNVSGNQGLQLIFTDGKRLLIGTQKPLEIESLLLQLIQKKILKTHLK